MNNNMFSEILKEMQETHDRKSKDYGNSEDPLANIRSSEKFGIPAWIGAVIRGNDKVIRIQSFVKKGRMENESLEDSLLDWAVYGVIALQLYRELKTHPKREVDRAGYEVWVEGRDSLTCKILEKSLKDIKRKGKS